MNVSTAPAEHGAPYVGATALCVGYLSCTVCGRAAKIADAQAPHAKCSRCGAGLPKTGRRSLEAVWAWLLAGVIFYVPANAYPMLITAQFGRRSESTIVGGAFELIDHHAYFIALIVLFASVVIPIAKFVVIARLALAASGHKVMPPHRALHLYEAVEFIGRWSMIDVFVVAILAALVQMGFLGSLAPGSAAAFFALSVGATMLSARAFDPRLIWDRIEAAPEVRSEKTP
ncbi:MAG: paraquat-inducible protein A [Pikeienuella sp.]